MHSSLLLLAAVTSDSMLAFLLIDLNYSVILAEHIVPIPSALASADIICIQLVQASPSQVLLSLSPTQSSAGRSVILVVPLFVPSRSTLAGAMRCARVGAKWLAADDVPLAGGADLDQHERAMLAKVKGAVAQKKASEADAAYDAWGKFALQQGTRPEHELTRQLLLAGIQPGKPHPAKMIHDLLQKQLVTNSMVEGGLLPTLLERKDWVRLNRCADPHISLRYTRGRLSSSWP
jgi:hypothetical protein